MVLRKISFDTKEPWIYIKHQPSCFCSNILHNKIGAYGSHISGTVPGLSDAIEDSILKFELPNLGG